LNFLSTLQVLKREALRAISESFFFGTGTFEKSASKIRLDLEAAASSDDATIDNKKVESAALTAKGGILTGIVQLVIVNKIDKNRKDLRVVWRPS